MFSGNHYLFKIFILKSYIGYLKKNYSKSIITFVANEIGTIKVNPNPIPDIIECVILNNRKEWSNESPNTNMEPLVIA